MDSVEPNGRPTSLGGQPSRRSQRVAGLLADEIRDVKGGTTWKKVTTLLDMFGATRLSTGVRERLGSALSDAGLEVDPPLNRVRLQDTVRLTLRDTLPEVEASDEDPLLPEGVIRSITTWEPEFSPELVSIKTAVESAKTRAVAGLQSAAAPVWVDVDLTAAAGHEEALLQTLRPLCGPDLTEEMIEDLLDADPLPKVRRYTDDGRVRAVSAVTVAVSDAPMRSEERQESAAGSLEFGLLETLSAERWLITCWHRGRIYTGAKETESEAPDPKTPAGLFAAVERRWQEEKFATVGDLGMLLLHEAACTYAVPRLELDAWLERWELSFYNDTDRIERRTLIEIRSLMAEFRRRVNAMAPPGDDVATAWFPTVTNRQLAERTANLIQRTLRDLRELSDMLRTSFDLVQTSGTVRQLRLAQRQQVGSERLQRRVEAITSAFLVPALVAGVFGANTALPGGNDAHDWTGFVLMLAAMAVFGVLTFWTLRHMRVRAEREAAREAEALAEPEKGVARRMLERIT